MSILSMPTFSSAPISYCVMMESSPSERGPGPFGRRGAHRHVLRERARGNHHTGGVHRHVARNALDSRAELHESLVGGIAAHEVLHFVHPLRGFGNGQTIGGTRRDELGDSIGFARGDAKDARHVLYRGAGLHRPERDDLPDARAAVALANVLDDLPTPLETEIDVDVRHRHAFGIQETLEEEIELERADVGDAAARTRRSSPRPNRARAPPGSHAPSRRR